MSRYPLEHSPHEPAPDEWRVEASFSHLYGPVDWHKGIATKAEVYWRVGMALMSENIQWVKVFKEGKLHQTITVEETPDAHHIT